MDMIERFRDKNNSNSERLPEPTWVTVNQMPSLPGENNQKVIECDGTSHRLVIYNNVDGSYTETNEVWPCNKSEHNPAWG